jgi:hypothetical protein
VEKDLQELEDLLAPKEQLGLQDREEQLDLLDRKV